MRRTRRKCNNRQLMGITVNQIQSRSNGVCVCVLFFIFVRYQLVWSCECTHFNILWKRCIRMQIVRADKSHEVKLAIGLFASELQPNCMISNEHSTLKSFNFHNRPDERETDEASVRMQRNWLFISSSFSGTSSSSFWSVILSKLLCAECCVYHLWRMQCTC